MFREQIRPQRGWPQTPAGLAPAGFVEYLGELRQILERDALEFTSRPEGDGSHPGQHPVVTVGGLIFDAQGRVLMIRTHKWSNL